MEQAEKSQENEGENLEKAQENQQKSQKEASESQEKAPAGQGEVENNQEKSEEQAGASPIYEKKKQEASNLLNAASKEQAAAIPKKDADNSREADNKPKKTSKNPKKAALTIRGNEEVINAFKELAGDNTHFDFFQALIEKYQAPTPPPEKIEIPKEVEVEKPFPENSVLVRLTDKQMNLLEAISNKRFKRGLEVRQSGGKISRETKADILQNSFFNRNRLYNLDNEFFTGLEKNDLK
jgi:hypothetical protein